MLVTLKSKQPLVVHSHEDYPMEAVMRIIQAEQDNPMSSREATALDQELAAYATKHAKKLGIKERDIPRIVHESRVQRRAT